MTGAPGLTSRSLHLKLHLPVLKLIWLWLATISFNVAWSINKQVNKNIKQKQFCIGATVQNIKSNCVMTWRHIHFMQLSNFCCQHTRWIKHVKLKKSNWKDIHSRHRKDILTTYIKSSYLVKLRQSVVKALFRTDIWIWLSDIRQ